MKEAKNTKDAEDVKSAEGVKTRRTQKNAFAAVLLDFSASFSRPIVGEKRVPVLFPSAGRRKRIIRRKRGFHKVKKKTKVVILTLSCLLAVALAVGVLLGRNPHWLYIAGETLGVRCRKVAVKEAGPGKTEGRIPTAWGEDPRVTLDQSLLLVNEGYPLPEDFSPALTFYRDTEVPINECAEEAYGRLSEAVEKETGSRLFVSSSFREEEEQKELYEKDPSTANRPGASEHQTGLGLDVYVRYYAGFGFIKSEAGRFVNSHCWEYGFIIRYPSFGKKETGMKYEPWHIRYVGEPHAKIIYNNRLTLEEYLAGFEPGVWYEAEGYLLSRQEPDGEGRIFLPEEFSEAVISPDNTGAFLVTVKK